MNEVIQDSDGTYWLSKPQGLYLACLGDTKPCEQIRLALVKVYQQFQSGKLAARDIEAVQIVEAEINVLRRLTPDKARLLPNLIQEDTPLGAELRIALVKLLEHFEAGNLRPVDSETDINLRTDAAIAIEFTANPKAQSTRRGPQLLK